MKNRSYLVGLIVLLLLLLSGWLFLKRQPDRGFGPSRPATASRLGSANGSTQLGTSTANALSGASAPSATADPKVAQMHALVAAENARPINVYGKVIDQFGRPVADAKVKGGTLLVISFDRSGGEEFSTVTDAEGRFSFTGLHGARFGLGLEKPGYEYDPKRYLGWWDHYKPDPSNPVIFTMWKLQGAEPMLAYAISTAVPCDGSPTRFNLLTGKKVSRGGDFIVTLVRQPVNIRRGTPFDWSVTVAIAGGGLMELHDLYPNEAPADGYQPSVTITMPATMKSWDAALNRSFYFRRGSGPNYGRITIHLQADFQPPPTYLGADVFLNPTPRDRNLEFDPAKAIPPK